MLYNVIDLFVHDIQTHNLSEEPLVEGRLVLVPCCTGPFCKLDKVLLGAGTDLMWKLAISVIKFCQIGFCKHLRLRMLDKKLIFLSLGHTALFLLILATGPFVIPVSSVLITHNCRCKNSSGEIFHSDMKRMVREKVSITDFVLLISVFCNIRNQHHCLFRSNHR